MIKYKILLIVHFLFYIISLTIINKSNKVSKIFNTEIIKNVLNYSLNYDEFDNNVYEKITYLQNFFCENPIENLEPLFENKLKIANVTFNGSSFNMFVYNNNDLVSKKIFFSHQWEPDNTKKILKALEYYSQKKKAENKDIYMLDIGANVGWYTYFLGKYGFKIISFEASKINNYILYKNYCLNKDVNVTIINKGLDLDDKKCILKTVKSNIGDGAIFCENREEQNSDFNGEIFYDIELTKLSKYIKFFSDKNLALMKLDVEGAEGSVIYGGKEIISKYHIPFIIMEFRVKLLESHRTNVLEFLQFFENNGYKFSLTDFLSNEYISSSERIKNNKNWNLFIVYDKFLNI